MLNVILLLVPGVPFACHIYAFFVPPFATPLLQSDIAALYIKVGVKNIGTVFLHTDAQIPDERFLVLINDMLASGLATLIKYECLFMCKLYRL